MEGRDDTEYILDNNHLSFRSIIENHFKIHLKIVALPSNFTKILTYSGLMAPSENHYIFDNNYGEIILLSKCGFN
jgi:hypothetical protein